MTKKSSLFISILTAVIGLLFIILKNDVIGISMTIIGVFLIVMGVLYLIDKLFLSGVIWIVIGVVIIVFGWVLATVVIYILAVYFIISGIINIINLIKAHTKGTNFLYTLLIYAFPVFSIIIGILLCFNQGGTIAWIFIVCGILLLIDGIVGIVQSLVSKEK